MATADALQPVISARLKMRADDEIKNTFRKVSTDARSMARDVTTATRDAASTATAAVQRSANVLAVVRSDVAASAQAITGIFNTVGQAAGALASKIAEVGTAAGVISGVGAAGFTGLALGLSSFVNKGEEAQQGLNTLRDTLGLSVEDVQRFQSAVRQQGGSTDDATKSLTHLRQAYEDSLEKGDDAATPFGKLGIALHDSEGNALSFGQVLSQTMDVVGTIPGKLAQAKAASELFGASYKPVVDVATPGEGRHDNWRDRMNEADKVGAVVSQAQIDRNKAMEKSADDTGEAFVHLGNTIVNAFFPLLASGGANPIKQWVADNTKTLDGYIKWTASSLIDLKRQFLEAWTGEPAKTRDPFKGPKGVKVTLDGAVPGQKGATPAAKPASDDDDSDDDDDAPAKPAAGAAKPAEDKGDTRPAGPGDVVTVVDGKRKVVHLKSGDDDESDDDDAPPTRRMARISMDGNAPRNVPVGDDPNADLDDPGPKVKVFLDGAAGQAQRTMAANGAVKTGITNGFLALIAPALKAVHDAFDDIKGWISGEGNLGDKAAWLGDIAKTVTDFANVVEIVWVRISMAFEGIGKALTPNIDTSKWVSPLHLLAEASEQFYRGFAQLASADPSSMFARIGGLMRDALEWVVAYVGAWRRGETAIQAFASAAWKAAGGLFTGAVFYAGEFATAMGQAFTRGAIEARNSFAWLNPAVELVIEAMDAIHAAVKGADTYPTNAFSWLPPLVRTVEATIKGLFVFATRGVLGQVVASEVEATTGGTLAVIYAAVRALLPRIGDIALSVFHGVVGAVRLVIGTLEVLWSVFEPVLNQIARWYGFTNADGSGNGLALLLGFLIYNFTGLGAVIDYVRNLVLKLFLAFAAGGTLVTYVIGNVLGRLAAAITPLSVELLGITGGWVLLLVAAIGVAAALVYVYWDSIKAGASATLAYIESVFSAIGAGLMAVVGFFMAAPGAIVSFFGDFRNNMVRIFRTIRDDIIQSVVSVIAWFEALPAKIVNALRALPGQIKRLFNSSEQNAYDDAMADPKKWMEDHKDDDYRTDEQKEFDRVSGMTPEAYKAEKDAQPETWAEKWTKWTGGRGIMGLLDPSGTDGDNAFSKWLEDMWAKIYGKAKDAKALDDAPAAPNLADEIQRAIPGIKDAPNAGIDGVLDYLRNNSDEVRGRGVDPEALREAIEQANPHATIFHDFDLNDFAQAQGPALLPGAEPDKAADPWAAHLAAMQQSMQGATSLPKSDYDAPPAEMPAGAAVPSSGTPIVLDFGRYGAVSDGITATPAAAGRVQDIYDRMNTGVRAPAMRDSNG